jgi:hypothetical protein
MKITESKAIEKIFSETLQFVSSFSALVIGGELAVTSEGFCYLVWGICKRAAAKSFSTNRANGQPHSTARRAAGAIVELAQQLNAAANGIRALIGC